MRASVFVGRVGGLAVALGIGAAVGGLGSGAAAASPTDSTDSSATAEQPAPSASARDRASGPAPRSKVARSEAPQSSTDADSLRPNGVQRQSASRASASAKAAADQPESDELATTTPPKPSLRTVEDAALGVVEERRVETVVSAPVPIPTSAEVAINGSSAAGVSTVTPAVAAEPPSVAPAASAAGTVDAVATDSTGSLPAGPVGSAVSWAVFAAARRENGTRATVHAGWGAKASTGQPLDTETVPAAAAVADGVDLVAAAASVAAAESVDPITAIIQQVQAVIGGIVDAVIQVVNQVVSVVNQIVTSIVNIFVPTTPANSAPTVTAPTVGVPDAATGTVTGTVAGTDADGDTLTYTAPATTGKGSVAVDASTGAFTYTPTVAARQNAAKAGATAADQTDTFTVTVSDGKGGAVAVAVAVAISPLASTPSNSAPVAGVPTVGAPDPSTGVVTGKVTATDLDGDSLAYNTPLTSAKGIVSINTATGAFTYTPTSAARQNAAKAGATDADKVDQFTVTVSDGQGGTVAVQVAVPVAPAATPINAAPVVEVATIGASDAASGVVNGSVSAVDPDGDSLTFSGSTQTAKGSVTVAANGSFAYTPTAGARHAAARVGAAASDKVDTFTITVSDGEGGTATTSVSVVIAPQNSAPVAGTPTVGTPELATGEVTGNLAGTDADGDALTYSLSLAPTKGSVRVAANGTYTYVPDSGARDAAALPGASDADRMDSFALVISDGYGGLVSTAVTVPISPSPGGFPTVGFARAIQSTTEGNSGSREVPLTVSLSQASDATVTVDYTVKAVSATAGEDFEAATGTLSFAPGQTEATLPVTIYGDTRYEGNEQIHIDLANPSGAALVVQGAEGSRSDHVFLALTNDDIASGEAMAASDSL